ncbi:MAG: SpoIVB peptidase S55 domain-containing protein [Polyangiales bacterium]
MTRIISKPRRIPTVCLLAAALCCFTVVGTGQWSVKTMSVDEIRAGMRGYGLSVFQGTTPERFDVEVIDVLHNFRPAQDLILIRTPHPLLNRARGVGGMSGSPIYIDGKLIGAYAYGWAYGTDPVVGVTPIANMLADLKRPLRKSSFVGFSALPRAPLRDKTAPAPESDFKNATAFSPVRKLANRLERAQNGDDIIRPVATPIMLGGMTDATASALSTELRALGLEPTQAGGGSNAHAKGPQHFENGGAIGVDLISGDVSATAVGTVTYVGTKGRLLAFGHPMLDAGQAALPTATAKVVHLLVSEQRSFKLAESIAPLGTLIHDRQATIVVDTKMKAPQIPVRVRIHGLKGANKTEWNALIAVNPGLSAMLAFTVIGNALKSVSNDYVDTLYKATTRVGIAGHGTVVLHDEGFVTDGPSSMTMISQLRLFELMQAAFDNEFETTSITNIDVDLNVEFSRDVLQVVEVSATSNEVDPGSEIPIYVRIRRVDRGEEVRRFLVTVPNDAAGQTITVDVQPGPSVHVPLAEPRSFDDVINIVRSGYPATSLVLSIALPSRGLQFSGHVVDSLPGSALDAMHLGQSTAQPRAFATEFRQELELKKMVVGGGKLQLRVRPIDKMKFRGEKK